MPPTLIQRSEETTTTDRASTTCPACESDLVSGQGLAACVDCSWTGTYE
jgi:hypothetical protein